MEMNDASFYLQFSIDYIDNSCNNSSNSTMNVPDDSSEQSNQAVQNQRDLRALNTPKHIGWFYDKRTATSTIICQIGFLANEPVYRVSEACARASESAHGGDLITHRPALFADVHLELCGVNQVDVTIRR